MSELKVFTFGLGRYTEDGYPCVVAVDGEGNPRLASDEEFYLKSEADKVIAEKDKEIAELQAMLEERNKQVGELKEECRWRKCSDEMPQKYDDGDDFLIAVEHESTTCPKGYYVTIAELVDGSWSDDEGGEIDEYIEYDLDNSIFRSQAPKGTKKGFYRNKVTHWMPIPKAPEEAK